MVRCGDCPVLPPHRPQIRRCACGCHNWCHMWFTGHSFEKVGVIEVNDSNTVSIDRGRMVPISLLLAELCAESTESIVPVDGAILLHSY